MFLGMQAGVVDPLLKWLIARQGGDAPTAAAAAAAGRQNSTTPVEFAVHFMQKRRMLAPYAARVKSSPWAANFVLAWLITETMEPLRIAATGALVPILAGHNSPKDG
jgi:hypothetical protein